MLIYFFHRIPLTELLLSGFATYLLSQEYIKLHKSQPFRFELIKQHHILEIYLNFKNYIEINSLYSMPFCCKKYKHYSKYSIVPAREYCSILLYEWICRGSNSLHFFSENHKLTYKHTGKQQFCYCVNMIVWNQAFKSSYLQPVNILLPVRPEVAERENVDCMMAVWEVEMWVKFNNSKRTQFIFS